MLNVFFLVRAYNDFDCRLPLMLEFSRSPNYVVHAIAVPTNRAVYNIKSHNLYLFALKNNIVVRNIYDFSDRLLVKLLLNLYFRSFGGSFTNRYTLGLFKLINVLTIYNTSYIERIFQVFKGSIVLIDEIILSRNRSYFIDKLREDWVMNNDFFLMSFLTGQNIFIDLNNPLHVESIDIHDDFNITLCVPGPNDKRIWDSRYQERNVEIVGNTRFDYNWIRELNDSSMDDSDAVNYGVVEKTEALTIVFMLSKLEYGVKIDELVCTINACAEIRNALVIVKPHTRGMKFSDLGFDISNKVVDGSDIPSSDLISMSNFILFTGSSIVFQAILLNKTVIYLKFCHMFETIFDTDFDICIANNVAEVVSFVENISDDIKLNQSIIAYHIHNSMPDGLVCKSIKQSIIKKAIKFGINFNPLEEGRSAN